MYIPAFWVGVFATLAAEVLALIVYVVWGNKNGKK